MALTFRPSRNKKSNLPSSHASLPRIPLLEKVRKKHPTLMGVRIKMSVEREIDLAKVSNLLRSSLARIVRNASVCEVTMDSIQKSRRAVELSEAALRRADDLIRRTGGTASD